MEEPQIYEWDAPIVSSGSEGAGSFVAFPWDPKVCFGKANLVPVRAEFNGEPYRGSIANMGSGPCLIVLKEIREKIGKQAGSTVKVRLWLDTEPRTVEAPADLAAAFTGNSSAEATWTRLANSHRKEYVRWIEGTKNSQTRAGRIGKAVLMLAEGKKLK